MDNRAVRSRFWLEAVCGVIGSVLLVMTLVTREWIEILFGVEPDGGSGALEVGIVLVFFLVAATSGLLAVREWRRPIKT